MPSIFVHRYTWCRLGHGGRTVEADYTVHIGKVQIRTYSTNGNMDTGYHGERAQRYAEDLAKNLSKELGLPIVHVRTGIFKQARIYA